MRAIQLIQKLSFLSLLIFGSGDSWSNLTAVVISAVLLGLTTLKLNKYGV